MERGGVDTIIIIIDILVLDSYTSPDSVLAFGLLKAGQLRTPGHRSFKLPSHNLAHAHRIVSPLSVETLYQIKD